jgi:hypothetical protein
MKLIVDFRKCSKDPKNVEGNANILRIRRIVHCCEERLNYYNAYSLLGLVTLMGLFMVDISEDENLDFAQNMDTVNKRI